MMTVEEKPDVTYDQVGGSKEQIEKLKEVVELPLLKVSLIPPSACFVGLSFRSAPPLSLSLPLCCVSLYSVIVS